MPTRSYLIPRKEKSTILQSENSGEIAIKAQLIQTLLGLRRATRNLVPATTTIVIPHNHRQDFLERKNKIKRIVASHETRSTRRLEIIIPRLLLRPARKPRVAIRRKVAAQTGPPRIQGTIPRPIVLGKTTKTTAIEASARKSTENAKTAALAYAASLNKSSVTSTVTRTPTKVEAAVLHHLDVRKEVDTMATRTTPPTIPTVIHRFTG